MNQLDEWKTRGPVRTLRTELAEWDLTEEQWKTPRRVTVTQFRTDGAISELEDHSPDRFVSKSRFIYDEVGRLLEVRFQVNDGPLSITHHHYDDLGRLERKTILQGDGTEVDSEIWNYDQERSKTKVQFVPRVDLGACETMFGIEGTQVGYGAEGIVEIVTLFGDDNQPSEARFYDTDRDLVLRVVFARDAAGKIISEEAQRGHKLPSSLEKCFAASADDYAEWTAVFARLLGQKTTYRYDDDGRQVERCMYTDEIREQRTTWHYDEHDNPVRQVEESMSREMQMDKAGNVVSTHEKSSTWEVQLDYKYDTNGNWIERVVSVRSEMNPEFRRSNIIRRKISYWVAG